LVLSACHSSGNRADQGHGDRSKIDLEQAHFSCEVTGP
jgi:hypothetical protein